MRFLPSIHALISWPGLLLLAALDTSIIFTLPVALDAVVVIMSATHRDLFWLVPLVATAGALVGAAASMRVGQFVGEQGLARVVPNKVLDKMRHRVEGGRLAALIVAPLMPPPFPLTAVFVVAGALDAGRVRVLSALGIGFAIRFSIESVLALIYGRRIIRWLNSDLVRDVAIGMIAIAVIASVISIARLVTNRSAMR